MDDVDVAGGRMGLVFALLWLLNVFLEGGVHCQGVYAPPSVRIVHSGQACNVEEEGGYTERVYTIREGETLELQCLTTGHPRPQVRWTKTSGSSVSYRVQDSSVFNDTLRIAHILRNQGGRYYCKADNGLGSPAIKSIRVDVYYLDDPVITVHQSVGGETREQFYFERTVFLRCVASSNPPVSYAWRRNAHFLSQGADKGVEIYEPFFTQGETKILKLKNLRPQDLANYTCVSSVRNVCGITDKSAHFNLNNRTASPSIRVPVDDPLVVNPGQTVTLPCVKSGGEPPPTLRWLRGGGAEGEELLLPERSAVSGGTLTLPAVTHREGGAYSCVASNNVGNPARKTATVLVRGLRKGRFWITPDPYHNDDHIQIGREVKISCQVEATPPEELRFSWLKNGRPLRSSERMVITHATPDLTHHDDASAAAAGGGGAPLGATSLDIVDLKFTDFGTYTCVAALSSGAIPELSIDVNISSTTVPPELSVPRGKSHLIVQEGDTVDLQCLVSGKPKPIILWSRLLQEAGGGAATGGGASSSSSGQQAAGGGFLLPASADVAMPEGSAAQTESYDGVLRLVNVSREMGGAYRCRTSQYNGFNVKPREAVIEVVVQFPPTVEPVYTEIRQGLGRAFSLNCRLLNAHPARILRYEWKLGSRLLTVGQMNERDETDYHVRALNREGYGEYTCDITNEAGAGRCTFLVTGKAYPPEFYYDTSSAVWQSRPRVYGFTLQWTQMNPDAVDRIVAYRLGIRQMTQSRWWEQEIPVERQMDRGQLLTYNLTELVKPESYLIRLTPISRYGEGDCTERTVTYSAPVNPHLREFQCGFEDEAVCLFSQDKTDSFDWTRHSAATRNTKYTPNTGPSSDRTGSKQGFYMYIETSRPRLEGDKARLLTPTFNVGPKVTHGSTTVTSNPTYCFSFYYHMYGKHIGALNVLLRQKAQTVTDTSVWSLSGNQGDRWRQTKINIHPTSAFQVVLEGVRGSGIEGDIAIDDVTIEEGVCKNPPSNNLRSLAPPAFSHIWQLCVTLALIGRQR